MNRLQSAFARLAADLEELRLRWITQRHFNRSKDLLAELNRVLAASR